MCKDVIIMKGSKHDVQITPPPLVIVVQFVPSRCGLDIDPKSMIWRKPNQIIDKLTKYLI